MRIGACVTDSGVRVEIKLERKKEEEGNRKMIEWAEWVERRASSGLSLSLGVSGCLPIVRAQDGPIAQTASLS